MTLWSGSTLHKQTHVCSYLHQPHQFEGDSWCRKILLPSGGLQRNLWMEPPSGLRPTNRRWKARYYCVSFVGRILETGKQRHVWSHQHKNKYLLSTFTADTHASTVHIYRHNDKWKPWEAIVQFGWYQSSARKKRPIVKLSIDTMVSHTSITARMGHETTVKR